MARQATSDPGIRAVFSANLLPSIVAMAILHQKLDAYMQCMHELRMLIDDFGMLYDYPVKDMIALKPSYVQEAITDCSVF